MLAPDPDDPPDRRDEELFTLIPRKRTTTFDVRRAIELMADRDSFFEIGPLWGTDQVIGFVRFNGHPIGVIASDSRHVNGGALTADGCDKLTRHLDLCDLFHLPVLNLVDNPGFAVGLEHEIAGTIRKGGEWMVAFAQVSVPIFTVLMRRSFGVAGNNFATPLRQPSVRVAWPAADVGGIPPEGGIEAAYKRQLAEAEDPVALRAELNARIESVRGPIGPLNRFQIEEMIDPRDTRRLVCEWAPTAYRLVNQPGAARAPRPPVPSVSQTRGVSDLSSFAKFVPQDHGLVVVSTTTGRRHHPVVGGERRRARSSDLGPAGRRLRGRRLVAPAGQPARPAAHHRGDPRRLAVGRGGGPGRADRTGRSAGGHRCRAAAAAPAGDLRRRRRHPRGLGRPTTA